MARAGPPLHDDADLLAHPQTVMNRTCPFSSTEYVRQEYAPATVAVSTASPITTATSVLIVRLL
jgi:hypothetical protein